MRFSTRKRSITRQQPKEGSGRDIGAWGGSGTGKTTSCGLGRVGEGGGGAGRGTTERSMWAGWGAGVLLGGKEGMKMCYICRVTHDFAAHIFLGALPIHFLSLHTEQTKRFGSSYKNRDTLLSIFLGFQIVLGFVSLQPPPHSHPNSYSYALTPT